MNRLLLKLSSTLQKNNTVNSIIINRLKKYKIPQSNYSQAKFSTTYNSNIENNIQKFDYNSSPESYTQIENYNQHIHKKSLNNFFGNVSQIWRNRKNFIYKSDSGNDSNKNPESENQKSENSKKQKNNDENPIHDQDITAKHKRLYSILKGIILSGFFLSLIWYFLEKEDPKININELQQMIKNQEVKEVHIVYKKGIFSFQIAQVFLNNGSKKTLHLGSDVKSLQEILRRNNIKSRHYIKRHTLKSLGSVALTFIQEFMPLFLIVGLLLMLYKTQNKTNNWAKSKVVASKSKYKFRDVAGIDEVLFEMKEFVDYLSRPLVYRSMGAKIPRGALLSGPPGTGKTLLVKACAGEAEVPFYSVSGSDFVEMFGGLGASRVREIFEEARNFAPSIIFIDEIDAIGKKRSDGASGSHGEREQTLNQLLCEMDGIGELAEGQVIIFAATNTPDVLDDALLRPGRIDRRIEVTLPDLKGRKEILAIHLQGKKVEKGSFLKNDDSASFFKDNEEENAMDHLAAITNGFSGADLENLCNEAAILAARDKKDQISKDNFEAALDRIQGGVLKGTSLQGEVKSRAAIFNSAKVLVAWLNELADPIVKVNLVPRSKQSMGVAQSIKEDVSLRTEEELYERISVKVAGKLAEDKFYNSNTSSLVEKDLKGAYQIARNMITNYGMSQTTQNFHWNEKGFKSYSSHSNEQIDKEIENIIEKVSVKTETLIDQNWDKLITLKELLEDKMKLELRDIQKILGPRPGKHRPNFAEFQRYMT